MNLRSSLRHSKESETSALNDILFILLFFFLIISTLANPNLIKVSVPKASSDSKAKQTVVVTVDSLQRFYINTHTVSEDSLQSAIAAAVAKSHDAEPTVVINGDRKAQFDNIVAVMRAAKALRLKTVVAVDKEK
ncbi:MAG: biopolymer transporter ExbD [Chitinophagaceae bacterium]|uniref:Biopolymer transporter ExbD n=1 Tax=Rurimicrobium arvi TaxID=2049916 RepID=A0ABP8MVQ8_9BACT